jgi:hypothetical protein
MDSLVDFRDLSLFVQVFVLLSAAAQANANIGKISSRARGGFAGSSAGQCFVDAQFINLTANGHAGRPQHQD